jgi:hypothetical protein
MTTQKKASTQKNKNAKRGGYSKLEERHQTLKYGKLCSRPVLGNPKPVEVGE